MPNRVYAESVHGPFCVTVFYRGSMPGDKRMTPETRNRLAAENIAAQAVLVRDALNEYLDRHPEVRG